MRIRFDDRDAVVKSEERTLTKAEAPTLRVHPHTNGGVQVEGWDKDVYSVTACKAAANYDGNAERLLSQMKLSVQNGEVSTTGPSDENDWTVYLLIRAPKASVIDLETANGPLSLYSVDGKLTARATNGPITLRDFSGDADDPGFERPYHHLRKQRQRARLYGEWPDLHQSERADLERSGFNGRCAERSADAFRPV